MLFSNFQYIERNQSFNRLFIIVELPEGYRKETYPSAKDPKRIYFKIHAPDGQVFSTITKAIEHFESNKHKNSNDFNDKDGLETKAKASTTNFKAKLSFHDDSDVEEDKSVKKTASDAKVPGKGDKAGEKSATPKKLAKGNL